MSELPVVDPPFDNAGTAARVEGILLAAGTSDRYGDRNKLLATHDGDPLVRRAVRTLATGPVEAVTVVVGHDADRVADAVSGFGVETVHNDAYATGQASSVRTGVRAIRDRADAVVVALGDMPFVAPSTIETLVDAHAAGVGDALAAACEGRRGNPVLFDRRFFDALVDVTGDVGGRELLLRHGRLIETGDPGVRRDVDVPSDL
jgi:molybdenum cofactor cytidylyltransferase